MDIADWRKRIDEVDRKLVELLNERARAARAIGAIKRDTQSEIYEPDREREIFENIRKINPGVLPEQELMRVYERIIDVMRKIQRDEMPLAQAAVGGTELEAEVNE
jgi:chorismate mutase